MVSNSLVKFKEHIFSKVVVAFCLLISISVILGWVLELVGILSIIPQAATMKFNTALIFLFQVSFYFYRKKQIRIQIPL